MAKVTITAEEFATKQATNLKNALPAMEAGVDRVTEAPGKKAAAQAVKMKANIIKSIDDGKWARNVASVTLEEWKTKMKTKGLTRIAVGIDEAHGKVVNFAGQLISHIDAGAAKIDAMPTTTLEQAIAKATANIRHMATFKPTK